MIEKKSVFVAALALAVLLVSFADAEARLWNRAEWHFNAGFINDEIKPDMATDNATVLRLNVSGSTVYSVANGVLACSGSQSLLEFLQIDINDMVATGGSRVNEYSMIWDIKTDSTPADIGLFNADTANANDAELWLDGNGDLGSSGKFTNGGPVASQSWTRIVATYREENGFIIENLYVNGVKVLLNTNRGGYDGSFSLSTDAQAPNYQIALFGANLSGNMYLDNFELENFGFVLNELTAEEVSWLGDANVDGIGLSQLKTPRINVKCNGEDSGVVVPAGTNVTLTYDLEARAATGYTAEVWLVVSSPFGPFSYDGNGPYNGWNYGFGSPLQSGALTDLSGTALDSTLPAGLYDVYFGFDWLVNGHVDSAYIFDMDMVDVDVQ